MGLFNKDLKIGIGQKYDVNKISAEGVTKEERAALEKKNNRMIDIFKAFDFDSSGDLSQIELAAAMDAFGRADVDQDGKLSKNEFNDMALVFNSEFEGANVSGKDFKAFLKGIIKSSKGDEKVETNVVIAQYTADMLAAQETQALQDAQVVEDLSIVSEEQVAEQTSELDAQKQDLATPKAYTVQEGETLTGLLTRSLKAQGIEVTKENLARAKEEFAANNPGALHGKEGSEYLYAGAEVKISGNLENKNNAKEINERILARRQS